MNVFSVSTNPMYSIFSLDSARVCIFFNTPLDCKCYHRLYMARIASLSLFSVSIQYSEIITVN